MLFYFTLSVKFLKIRILLEIVTVDALKNLLHNVAAAKNLNLTEKSTKVGQLFLCFISEERKMRSGDIYCNKFR